jgi:hypothetical protein
MVSTRASADPLSEAGPDDFLEGFPGADSPSGRNGGRGLPLGGWVSILLRRSISEGHAPPEEA